MAIKTFTAGSVLTASDTNTYLANSGLVYITQVTVGSGVSSIAVSNCFSSTYENYFVTYSGGTASTTGNSINLQLGSSSTAYYGILIYASYAGSGVAMAANNSSASWSWIGGTFGSNGAVLAANVYQPYLNLYTRIATQTYNGDAAAGTTQGIHKQAQSYTGFTLVPESGTLTGGTVTVYGYRKA